MIKIEACKHVLYDNLVSMMKSAFLSFCALSVVHGLVISSIMQVRGLCPGTPCFSDGRVSRRRLQSPPEHLVPPTMTLAPLRVWARHALLANARSEPSGSTYSTQGYMNGSGQCLSIRGAFGVINSVPYVMKKDEACMKPDEACMKPGEACMKPKKACRKPDEACVKLDEACMKPDEACMKPA